MNSQDQLKRKYPVMPTFKSNIQPLISAKQRKKTQVSREKDERKMMTQQRNPNKIINNIQDQNVKANTKAINFKTLKDTMPKKQIVHTKTQLKVAKTHTEYYPKGSKPQNLMNQGSHGISINVNIQNMIPKNNQNFNKNDRNTINEDKRKSKRPMIMKFQQFQCNQEINFKRGPLQPKNKFQDKNTQKVVPLIDRKQIHRTQIQQTSHTNLNNHPTQRMEIQPKIKTNFVQQKQILKKLQSQAPMINQAAQNQAMMHLDQRQQQYLVPPYYLQKNQANCTWMMRVILFEWMMHVSYQFAMKRQTFHIAVNLVDLYMSKQHHLPKSHFQLIGAASMFIASKLQEFEPKCSQQFAESTRGRYSANQIKQMQRKICKTLKYRLNPPTINMWANRFMLQWDSYIQNNHYAQFHPLFATCQPCYFKRCEQNSLKLFRQLMQYLDCAILHIHTMQYKPKLLVFAFMYLVLGKQFQIFDAKQIASEFPDRSHYLLDQQNLFNDLFMSFLQQSFGIILLDLLPTIQYAASYFILVLDFSNPITAKKQEIEKKLTLQDFCSYQTHNPNMTLAIKNRNNNLR